MNTLSNLSIEIEERLLAGQEPREIARALEIPVSWVYEQRDSQYDEAGYAYKEEDYDQRNESAW